MGRLKAALIGAGGMGQLHLKAMTSCREVEVAAVCDVDEELLSKLARELGAEAFTDFREMLRRVSLDFVVVALPHWLHLPAVREAAARGVHVLKEKPLARSLEEAREVVRVAEEAGIKLMLATQRRFARTFSYAKELIDRGELGDIFLVRGDYTFRWGRPTLGWRGVREKSGGGALLDAGYHTVDLTYWYKGVPEVVYCLLGAIKALPFDYETEDTAVVAMRYPDGCVGRITVSWATAPNEERVTVHGTEGYLVASWDKLVLAKPDGTVVVEEEMRGDLWLEALKRQLLHFVDCIRRDAEPISSGRENLNVMRILDACYRSAASGAPVAL